jgi:4-hydroxy-4-methyl-2-oxoglutarate aldolase
MSENDLTEAELLELGAATVGESGGRAMRSRIRAAWSGARLAAPAFPVRCTPGDNLAIHVAVAEAPSGFALVVDVGDQPELGYWGEVLTTGAQARGLAGLVIDGGVRDVSALGAHHFPVFSTMIALRGATKNRPGTIGAAVMVGDVEVHTGDWVVGDADGVTVVPAPDLPRVLAAGRARAAKEEAYFAALRSGATTMTLLDLDGSSIKRE